MGWQEADFLPLSGIQHFAFCPRQWALIHLEQQWADNLRTVEGDLLHERVHDAFFTQKRNDVVISRGMRVFSHTLGVAGACDAVEFHRDESGVPLSVREGTWRALPIEYKRGKEKTHDADQLQLCAQAICLEEMLVCRIEKGYLYYGETKRRTEVPFTADLRTRTAELFAKMHELSERGYTPKVKVTKACRACSLAQLCLPKLCKNISAKAYISNHIMAKEESE